MPSLHRNLRSFFDPGNDIFASGASVNAQLKSESDVFLAGMEVYFIFHDKMITFTVHCLGSVSILGIKTV